MTPNSAQQTRNQDDNNNNKNNNNSSQKRTVPSVADFAALLGRNRAWLFKWLRQVALKCPDLTAEFRQWSNATARLFRRDDRDGKEEEGHDSTTRAALEDGIVALWTSLPPERRSRLGRILDAYAHRLDAMARSSLARLQTVLDDTSDDKKKKTPTLSNTSSKNPIKRLGLGRPSSSSSSSSPSQTTTTAQTPTTHLGPGVFLAKAQALLDETPITPASPMGPPRRGRHVRDDGGSRGLPAGCVRVAVVVQTQGEEEEEEDDDHDDGGGSEQDTNATDNNADVVAALGRGYLGLLQTFVHDTNDPD